MSSQPPACDEDIAVMENYLKLSQVAHSFRYSLTINPDLDLEKIEFPPMIIQPSLENAIKHGIAGMGGDGLINLAYKRQGNDLVITITDNGRPVVSNKGKRKGHGLEITRDMISNLKKLHPKEDITYQVSHTDSGTIVMFVFINWLNKVNSF